MDDSLCGLDLDVVDEPQKDVLGDRGDIGSCVGEWIGHGFAYVLNIEIVSGVAGRGDVAAEVAEVLRG